MKYNIKKMAVSIRELNAVIKGSEYLLEPAFIWCWTPQGHDYWSDQRRGKCPLDISALEEIRRQHYAPKSPRIEVGKTYTAENGIEFR